MAGRLIDVQASAESSCDNCPHGVAKFWCQMCKKAICEPCYRKIHEQPALTQHTKIPIEQKPIEKQTCKEHPDEIIKYWCHNCSSEICLDCRMSEIHKDHEVTLINESASKKIKELVPRFIILGNFLNAITQEANGLINSNENANMQQITQTFNQLRIMIDKCENDLKNQIHNIEQKNRMSLEEYQTSIQSKQQILSNEKKNFEKLTSRQDYIQLLKTESTLTNFLTTFENDLSKFKLPTRIDYRVEGTNQLQTKINEFLKQLRVIEEQPVSARFAAPQTEEELHCGGRPCVKCGRCCDWFYSGDLETWNWIRSVNNWDEACQKRWNDLNYSSRFKCRNGYQCDPHVGGGAAALVDALVGARLVGRVFHGAGHSPFGRYPACVCAYNYIV